MYWIGYNALTNKNRKRPVDPVESTDLDVKTSRSVVSSLDRRILSESPHIYDPLPP